MSTRFALAFAAGLALGIIGVIAADHLMSGESSSSEAESDEHGADRARFCGQVISLLEGGEPPGRWILSATALCAPDGARKAVELWGTAQAGIEDRVETKREELLELYRAAGHRAQEVPAVYVRPKRPPPL